MTQADHYPTFTQSFHVKDHPSLVTKPWDVEDPFLVQAAAESEICQRDKQLPKIIGLVREAVVPYLLGNPACKPNNFYDDLALESSPEGYLEALDRMGPAVPERESGRISWFLPAQGAARKGGYVCGNFLRRRTYGCPEGHEVHAVRCTCHKLSCPVCYPDAVRRMAERIVNTMGPALQLHDGALKLHHVIVSPPQEWAEGLAGSKAGFSYLKGQAWGVLEKCGSAGATVMFHPYRGNEGSKVWRVGPHFHAVSAGWIDSSRAPPGWVVKDMGELPADRLFPLAYYIVSHAGVPEGWDGKYKAVNYFGCFSTAGRKGIAKVGEWFNTVIKECKTCKGPQFRYMSFMAVRHGGHWCDDDLQPVTERRAWVAWCLRTDARAVKPVLDGLGLDDALLVAGSDRRIYIVRPEVPELVPEDVDKIGEEDGRCAEVPSRASFSRTA